MAAKSVIHEQTQLPIITTAEAVNIIKNHYQISEPALLWGKPGCGKTSAVRQAGKELGEELKVPFTVKEAYLSRMTPADVGGLPALDKENHKTTFYLPDLLTDLPTEHGILFFDELTTADPQTRAAVMNLILEKRLGEFTLPEGWFCVAAANPKEWGELYGDLGAAMNNRFTQYSVEANLMQWLDDWAPENNINPLITAFLRNVGAQRFDTSAAEMADNPKIFPTPRSWARVSRILNVVKTVKERNNMIKGTIGFVAAGEFIGFITKCGNMLDTKVYLQATEDPKYLHKIMPTETGSLFVLACSMPMFLEAGNTKQNNQVYSLLAQMYFAKETWGDKFTDGTMIKDIAVVGWELAGRKAIDIDQKNCSMNPDFTRYNAAQEKILKGMK